jgi:hypothetical protein
MLNSMNSTVWGSLVLSLTLIDKFGKYGQKLICTPKQSTIYTAPVFKKLTVIQ